MIIINRHLSIIIIIDTRRIDKHAINRLRPLYGHALAHLPLELGPYSLALLLTAPIHPSGVINNTELLLRI